MEAPSSIRVKSMRQGHLPCGSGSLRVGADRSAPVAWMLPECTGRGLDLKARRVLETSSWTSDV